MITLNYWQLMALIIGSVMLGGVAATLGIGVALRNKGIIK